MGASAWVRAVVILLLAGSTLTGVAPAHALGETASPDIGPPGTTYSFTATGFAANEIVHVVIEAPDGQRTRLTDRGGLDIPFYADGGGVVRWSYTTPATAPDGLYIAEAANVSRQVRRRIGFIVEAGADPAELAAPAPSGNVTVRPEIGPPGTLFVFRTSGFGSFERVAIWLHTTDGSISALSSDIGGKAEHYADRAGNLQWVVSSNASTADGRYVAVAAGVSSGTTRVAAFTVQRGAGQAAPLPTENAGVTPAIGPPGTSFAFTGSGFMPGEGIGIWIHKPDGQIATISADGKSVKANAQGTASWSITASTSLADGVYSMVAEGLVSTQVRVVRFEIRR